MENQSTPPIENGPSQPDEVRASTEKQTIEQRNEALPTPQAEAIEQVEPAASVDVRVPEKTNELQEPESSPDAIKNEPPEQETPGETTTDAETTPPVQAPPKHGIPYRVAYFFLGANSKVGKVVRRVLRWMAFSLVLFMAGVLSVHILIYQPTQRALDAKKIELTNVSATLAASELNLQTLQKNYATLQDNFQKSQTDLKSANLHILLLNVRIKSTDAQIAIATKDGAAALQALTDTNALLGKLLPSIQAGSPDMATQLQNRLNAAQSHLVSDPNNALADLDLFDNGLQVVEKFLFP